MRGGRITTDQARGQAMALLSTFVHELDHAPVTVREECTPLAIELATISAALLRCWAADIGVPPEHLLQDLALAQAVEEEVPPTT